MMRRYKRGVRLTAVCIILTLLLSGCTRRFDASGYVKAVLNLDFQGDTTKAMEMMDAVTKESLDAQHKEFVAAFVENNITNQMDMGELKTAKFSELVSKIFSAMRYDVGEAKKTGSKEYEVPVEIQPTDVFLHFQELLTADSKKIADKVRNGAYAGNDEEVTAQILRDIANNAYELLDVAYTQASYAKKKTVIVKVNADEGNEYSIDEEDMDNLVIKILRLDEIQG